MGVNRDLLISIIVPVYNLEAYISKCLESIYNQNLDKTLYEVILVDDGSSDNTEEIVGHYINNYDNLIYIKQKNLGVSAARNKGISCSSGAYILFVDGDDWIEGDSLLALYESIKNIKRKVDVIIMRSFDDYGIEKYPWMKIGVVPEFVLEYETLYKNRYTRGSVWGCAFNRGLLLDNNILFPEGVMNGEDSIFFSLVKIYAKSCVFFDIRFYHVFERVGSASRSMTLDRVYNYSNNLKFLRRYLLENCLNFRQKDLIQMSIYGIISNAVYYYLCLGLRNYSDLYNMLDLKYVLPIRLNSSYFKMNFKLRLLNFSFTCYCLFRQLYVKLSFCKKG